MFKRSIRFESFFVGGCRKLLSGRPSTNVAFTESAPPFTNDQNGHYQLHQAYVQAFLQGDFVGQNLVLHHGGGMTGAMWETTPDGRPGWLSHSVQRGFNTYVIDNVGRGRAGWPATELETLGAPVLRTEEEAWVLFRIGEKKDYAQKKGFANQRFPIKHLANLTTQFVPRWLSNRHESAAALVALLERIGPSVVVAHSQGSECVFDALILAPEKFTAVVLVEPSAMPDGFESTADTGVPILLLYGDYLDRVPLWRQLARRYAELVDGVRGAGGEITKINLTREIGPGFSHLPMMDNGSEKVFDAISQWLSAHTPKQEQIQTAPYGVEIAN